MKRGPLVSVVMPVGGWRAGTDRAIQSILAQTHAHLELLLIAYPHDDHWRRDLPADTRLHVLERDAPGIVSALNTGLAAARGDYIARMDDDDVARPDRLARQLRLLNSGVDFAGDGIALSGAVGNGAHRYANWLNSLRTHDAIVHDMLVENPLPHPTWMAHRAIWQQLGPYRPFDGPEDYDLVLRAWRAGLQFGKPDGIGLDWHEHPGRLTWQDSRYRREAFTALKVEAMLDPAAGLGIDRGRAIWLLGSGRHARDWCDALQCRGARVNGFVDISRTDRAREKRGLPVIGYAALPSERQGALLISALRQPEARCEVMRWCQQQGLRAGIDYVLGG